MIEKSAFPHIDGLFDLACRNGVDIRPTLLRVLTDLYIQKNTHTPDERAQFTELARGLIDTVDPVTRAAVACRLAGHRDTPPEILTQLGALIGDMPLPPPPKPPETPARDDLTEVFFAAGVFERRIILLNLDAVGPRSASLPVATETCRRLEAAALTGKIDEFARILESTLLLPHALADRVVHDPHGEPIVIAARALGMTAETLQRILLFVNPAIGQSVSRVYELASLFNEISAHAAETMVGIWRGRPMAQPRKSAHQPALYDDEQRSARSAATPSRYRTTRRSDSLAARFKSSGR